jgi:hypothetical protein
MPPPHKPQTSEEPKTVKTNPSSSPAFRPRTPPAVSKPERALQLAATIQTTPDSVSNDAAGAAEGLCGWHPAVRGEVGRPEGPLRPLRRGGGCCGDDEPGHRALPRLRLRPVRRRCRGAESAGLEGEGQAHLRRPQGEFILANNSLAAPIFLLRRFVCVWMF